MAIYCIISEIKGDRGPAFIMSETKRDISRKSRVFKFLYSITIEFDTAVRGSPAEYCHNVWYGKTRMVWLPDDEKLMIYLTNTVP